MTAFILTNEPMLRLGVFLGVFAVMATWELVAPRRPHALSRRARWPGNIGIIVLDTLIVRLLLPAAAVGAAIAAATHGWGVFNLIAWPVWIEIVLTVVLLDLAIYFQHRIFHAVPVLWRLHRMHHADLDLDVTSGARFHPFEILLSVLIKMGVVVALGAPTAAVVIFEIILNATAMFNHSNVAISPKLDAILRWLIVTPDVHRVHHSIIPAETNSNFGFNLPWWDRLFGTWRAQPAAGHLGMTIGLETFRDPGQVRLDRMLIQPFVTPKATSAPYQPEPSSPRADRTDASTD